MDNGRVIQVGATKPTEWNRQQYRVYFPSGLSPCLNTVQGGGLEPKIVCDMIEAKIISNPHGFNKGGEKEVAPACTSSKYQDNNFVFVSNPKIIQKFGDRGTSQYSMRDMAHTIPANPMSDRGQMVLEPRYRIRKLTPRECFRLMGVDDKDIDTIQGAGISNSQMYKMAGNSIVVDVLYHLFRKMLVETENEQQQMTLF